MTAPPFNAKAQRKQRRKGRGRAVCFVSSRLRRQRDLAPLTVPAFDFQMLWKQALAADDLHEHVRLILELRDLAPLAVVQVCRDLIVDADRDPRNLRLLAGQSEHADDFDRHALRRLDDATAAAAWAIAIDAPLQTGPNSLPRHLDQPERAGAQNLRASSITTHRIM